jgi:Fe-S cluster biosynthesis and repair protein YggX
MAEVACRRCGRQASGLESAPIPGKWGAIVRAQACADCWREWIEEQTRLINHERLLPAEPEHRKVLYSRMSDFLRLETT